MLGSRRAATLVVPAVAAAMFVLPGCSGDDGATDDSDTSETTASASPNASETATDDQGSLQDQLASEEPELPAARNTPASRRAFARYVVASWAYALGTNEATTVTGLSPKGQPCVGCRDLVDELAKRKRDGWFVDFPGVKVDRVVVKPSPNAPGVFVATATVDIPASRSYFDDGSYRNDNAAHPNTDFVVQMRLRGPRYVLLSYQVG